MKTDWNLSLILGKGADEDGERQKIEEAAKGFSGKWKSRKEYLSEPLVLAEALKEYESFSRDFDNGGRSGFYYQLKYALEQSNPEIKAKLSKIREHSVKIDNELQFFELELGKISEEKQKLFLQHPSLNGYKHFLEGIFKTAKHMLTEPEERIMNMTSMSSFSNWVSMTEGFLSKEEAVIETKDGKKDMPFSLIISNLDNPDEKTRDSAAAAFNKILVKHIETGEWEINSILNTKKVDDELRGFRRPDESRHLSDDIDTEIVDAMLSAVSSAFDIPKRYYKLKAKLFGKKKLKYHERNLPYGNLNKYKYEEAVSALEAVFSGLDPDFMKIFKKMQDGKVDVFPKKGKAGGAFCASHSINLPTYILLNYDDKLDDCLALAHEMGHAINDELIKLKQNSLNSDVPLSTAEVASTLIESFVLDELIEEAKEDKLPLIMKKLDMEIASVFRQVACYRFEQELHKDYDKEGYLSKEHIGKIFRKHMSSYMGEYVEQSEGSQNWWLYWHHIRSFFYVYSYASGILIAKSMIAELKKDKAFIEKIKVFLETGSSKSPREIFMEMGIDISKKEFWDKGINEIKKLLEEAESLSHGKGKSS